MIIPVFVGVLSGAVGGLCWAAVQYVLNTPGIYNRLGSNWHLVPPVLGILAALTYRVGRAVSTREIKVPGYVSLEADRRRALSDLLESFHFGTFVLHPIQWIFRGLHSLLSAFFGGIVGIEGGTVELSYASLPVLSRYMHLFIAEKQMFVLCTLSASLSVAFGAPFTGALIALELVQALEGRVRAAGVLSALTAYGVASLLQSTVLYGFFLQDSLGRLNVVGSLFMGLRPLNLDLKQSLLLGCAAALLGVVVAVLSSFSSRAIAKSVDAFGNLFQNKMELGALVTGLVMGACVWLVPESFGEPWRLWDDLTWLRLSSAEALVMVFAKWSLLVLAFAGWGSAGLFSPILLLGALVGYSLGNVFVSSWAIPLAIAGAAAALASSYRIPIAAAALVLEIGKDGPMWWLTTVAVGASAIYCHFFNVQSTTSLLLKRMGLHLVGGRVGEVLGRLTVEDAMYRDFKTIRDNASLQELREAVQGSNHNFLGVVSVDGKYLGILALEQIPASVRRILRNKGQADLSVIEQMLEIRDLVNSTSPVVLPTDTLDKALKLLQNDQCIAVVDAERKLSGLVFESSLAGRYKRELANAIIYS